MTEHDTGVDLYWLPLGSGGHSVRLNGRIFEAGIVVAQREQARTDQVLAKGVVF